VEIKKKAERDVMTDSSKLDAGRRSQQEGAKKRSERQAAGPVFGQGLMHPTVRRE